MISRAVAAIVTKAIGAGLWVAGAGILCGVGGAAMAGGLFLLFESEALMAVHRKAKAAE